MKRVRPMVFQARSATPVAAACLVANAARDTLAQLLGAAVEMRLLAPLVPSPKAWESILGDAHVYTLSGPRARIALIVRAHDALALSLAAFGEDCGGLRSLSPVEATVVDRIVAALAPSFAPLCGPGHNEPVRHAFVEPGGSYFELLIERPATVRIGVMITHTNCSDVPGQLQPGDLMEVCVELAVRTAGVHMTARRVAEIEVGTIVPITVTAGLPAVLTIAGTPLAHGECGVRGNRLALQIGPAPGTQGSSEL